MATSSSRNSDVRRAEQLLSAGTQEQQQGTTLSTKYCGEMSSTDCVKSGADEAAMVLQALQELPVISEMREAADQPQQVALLGDGGGAAAATGTDAVTVAGDKQEDEPQNNPRQQIITHHREQVLLWSVRKGLTPIVATAVDGFSRGEAVLETPSSVATAPVKKGAATLEDETPRTSAPSSEVSPTNNLCSHRSFQSSSASSTNANSTSASWCAASASRTAGGTEADDTDNRCLLPPAGRSPAEILAAAAAAVSEAASSSGAPPAADTAHSNRGPADLTGAARENAQDLCGHNVAAKTTPSVSVDAAAVTASDTSGAAAASEVLTTVTSAEAAAVLCSPAALSLLATPCPVEGAAGGRPACATGAQASVGPDAAAGGTATEKGSVGTAVDTAGITRTAGAAGVATANVDDAMGENVDAAPAADNEKSAHRTQCETTDCAGARLKGAPQELHETVTEYPVHEEEHQGTHLQEGGSSEAADHGATASDSFSCEKGGWEASFAEVEDTRGLSLMTLAVEDLAKSITSGAAAEDETAEVAEKDVATLAVGGAAASEEADAGAVGSLPPARGKTYRNAEHRGGSLLLWDCGSQPGAPVEEEVAAAAAVCPPPQTSLKVLPQADEEARQQQPGRMAARDLSDSLKNVSAGLAPLSATSCCSEFSASPFTAAFKGDISPVSCCSSSSTASVTSSTSSPLSSASCGTLACAAGVTCTTVPAAANEAAAPGEGAAGGETTATTGPAVAQPSASAAAGEGKEDANGISLPDMKTASATASTAATRDSNAPTWYVGFRLPLGAEGRQVLLRRLRRAYHAAPPTTRDAVLASHGLYFSRVPFATVSDLFKLSHLLGVFDFAVQCSHEFGGSGATGGASVSAGGGGGSHGGKKNHNHGKSSNKNGNSNQRQLCSGAGTAGEEGRPTGSTAEGVGDALSLAGGILPTNVGATTTPTAAAAGGRKSTAAAAPRAGVAAVAGHCGDARKAGSGELAEQISPAESNSTARGASKERAAAAAGDFGEVGVVCSAAGARGGATGRGDALAKNDEEELQAALKAATAAPRHRAPQQKRSAGRSSVCRAAARQQQAEQQQQHNLLKEIETLRSVDAAGGRPSGGDRNLHSKNVDWQTQQHILLQQLLQAGLAEQQAGATGGRDGKSTLEAEALALLNGELGKAAAGAATNALLPPFAGRGCCATKETQQQQPQLDEQLLLLQLQDHGKSATASCRRGRSKAVDNLVDSRNLRVEQQSQCFLSEAQQSTPRGGLQQQHQQQQATGGMENVNGGRTGAKRSCRPADILLQQEQRQLCSWPSSTPAAGEENNSTCGRQVQEGLMKAQLPSPADLLPFLAAAAEQLRNSSYAPPAGAAAARPPYRGSHKSEGRAVLGATLSSDCSGSGSSSGTDSNFFDWNGFLMENYLSTVREQPQQQQQQGQTDAMLFSASASSTSASTRASLIRAASPVAAVAPRQPEPRLQEEEIVRLTKRARTTATTTITTTTTRPTGGALSVAAGHEAAGAGVSTGMCAGLVGKEGVSQNYTPEEEALLSALLVAVGSSIREQQQQQQRRWTVNTVEEITRLLLQLNNTNSNSGTEEEFRGEGDLVRRMSHLQAKDNSAHGDGGGCKHSSSSNASPCGRAPFSTTTYGGNSVSSCGSTSKDGSGFGFRTSSSKPSSPTSVSVSPAENPCTSASLATTSVDAGAATAHHRGAEGATYDFALQSETRGVATHESQERFSMLPFLQGNSVSVAEQQQPQQDSVRRLLTSRSLSGGRSGCSSSVADSAAAGGGSKNRGQTDSGSSRDGHTDVFMQLTSQLQLLSAQVMQQQESQPGQQHHEHPAVEQQYQHHFQTQQACGFLQKLVSGPSALSGITAGAQEETVTAVSGRLCSAEKASEYAAGVQLLQLVELLQVQHRVSRLLSLFPKSPTSAVPPPAFPASVAAAASPPPSSISAAPLRPAGPPAAAGTTLLAPDSAAVAAADAPAATEHFASLLAGLASTILEGKASIANQAGETPGSTLLGLALGKADVATLLKGGGNSEPVQEPLDVYDVQQQQKQQRAPMPSRGAGSRGSTTKSSNSKRSANRSSNNKGNSTKSSSSKGSNRQGGDRKVSSAVGTELVHEQVAAPTGGGSVRGKGVSESSAALPKQPEAIVSNCVSHSNSFSTCCSDDVADLCTSRGGSSSSDTKSSHDNSGNLLDGMCSAQPTSDRGYARVSYSCGQSTDSMVDICMH